MIASLKEKAFSLLERNIARQGIVLQTRNWASGGLTEIDLHLPETDMSGWKQVQHIKTRVANGCYRDYSPSGWDAETRTCTLFVCTRHPGRGSNWARSLQAGQTVRYLGIAATPHRPLAGQHLVCLGDTSSLGHFLGLRQLANDNQLFYGAISSTCPEDRNELASFGEQLDMVAEQHDDPARPFLRWLDRNPAPTTAVTLYLAGRSLLVARLRQELRQLGYVNAQIKAQGFWS